MADLDEGVQIVPSTNGLVNEEPSDFGRYSIQVSEYSASGKKQDFRVVLPNDKQWGDVMLRTAILKQTTFQSNPVPMIIHGVIYADKLGLDIMAGDVYLVQGRPAISNKAKIKMALATGNIEGIETEIRVCEETFKEGPNGKDLECTATISVKGWKKPLVRRARLSRWFKPKNPNWVSNPEHMLELNTVAHACEYVAPGGTDSDEAPPVQEGHIGEAIRCGMGLTQSQTISQGF